MSTNNESNFLREEDQPQVKLAFGGIGTLSDVDIVAQIIGNGKNKKWHEAAAKIIEAAGGLTGLVKMNYREIARAGEISDSRAGKLVLAIELWRRSDPRRNDRNKYEIRGSRDTYNLLYPYFCGLGHEEAWIIYLTKKNVVIKKEQISKGGTDACIMDAKIVFKMALLAGAAAIIVAHNHPSGSLRPSQPDLDLTKKLKIVGEAVGLPIVDHVIITDAGYFSFLDEGFM